MSAHRPRRSKRRPAPQRRPYRPSRGRSSHEPGGSTVPHSPGAPSRRPATPRFSAEQRRNRILAALLPAGAASVLLGFWFAAAIRFTVETVDFAVHAVEVPATVVGVHRGSPEVEFAVGAGLSLTAVASGRYAPGSPRDITVYQHSMDRTLLSVDHPLATYVWFPVVMLFLVTALVTVLLVQRLRRFRVRLRTAAHEHGGGRTGRALWGPVLAWAAAAAVAAGVTLCSVVFLVNASTPRAPIPPGAEWAAVVGLTSFLYALAFGAEARLVHAEYAPAPVRPPDTDPPRGTRLLAGTLVAVLAAGFLTIIGLAVRDGREDRLAGHDTVPQTVRIIESSVRDSTRSPCSGSLTVAYEVDGLPHTSSVWVDCDIAETAVRFTDIEVLRSVDDPSLIALPENVR